MKKGLTVSILSVSMFILIGVLLSVRVFAADSSEKAYALAKEDCKKIATQLGEKTPANLHIGGTGLDTYSVGCDFNNEGSPGYATQQIEDIQINLNIVRFSRRTPEAARNMQAKKASSKDATEVSKDGFEKIKRETSDGSEYILKGYLVLEWPELRKTHTAEISINKGTCGVSVTARSRYKDQYPGYHVSDSKTGGDINKHPVFNHDRETEMLALARKKAEEVFSVLDCGNDISSPSSTAPSVGNSSSKSDTLNKSNYTQALVIEPPKESDFQKVKPSDFKIVYPISSPSAIPKPATQSSITSGNTFIGKVGGDGQISIDTPDGETATLADDLTAFDGEISIWRLVKGGDKPLRSPRLLEISIYEQDCHFAMQQANQAAKASDWSGDNVITKTVGDCSYINEDGSVRVLSEQGNIALKTPAELSISAGKADFGVGYDTKSGMSIVEVYNGSVEVSNKSGQAKTISSIYGSEIKQIEVAKDGTMNEKIAIPLSEWETFLASQQEKDQETSTRNNLSIVSVVMILGVGGLIFFLYRTSRFIPFYKMSAQKILELTKKIGKNNKSDKD